MNRVLIIIKSPGIGDLQILKTNIDNVSKEIGKPVTILAQKNTRAKAILKHDPYVDEVFDLEKRDFFNIISKIKLRKFDQCYIYSDSMRLYLIAKFSGISKVYHYPFFSKKGKNFYKTAKEFSEKILQKKVDSASRIYWDQKEIERAKKDYDIKNNIKNIVCGISASGSTKRWDINNYINLFKNISSKHPSKFFLAGGPDDEFLIQKVMSSVGNCVSLSKLNMEEIVPIIASCQYYIGNDTGFGHLSANLNSKCLMIFCDSPVNYGLWNNNIRIILPTNETIETFGGHNALASDKISFDEVLKKSLDLIT